MILYFIADESTGEMVDDTDYFRSEDKANKELINYPGCFVDSVDFEMPDLPYGAVPGNTIKFPIIELNKEVV